MLGLKTNPTLLLYSLLLLFPAYNALETSEAVPRTNDMSCIQNGFYNCSPQCFCNVSQDYFNTALAGISIFNLIWSFLFILCYFLLRELRQKPAEIILILAATNFLLAVKYVIEGINLLNSNPIIPRLNDPFCQEVGFMSMLLTNTLSFYQLTFYLYKVITLKNPIKASKITKKLYHTTTILLSLGLTIGEFMYGAIGRTIMGSCSLKTTSNYSIPAVLGGIFLVLSIGLTFMLRRNMKQRRKDLNLKETRYAEHYLGYLIILCIVLIGVIAIQIDFSERIRKALTNYNIGKYTNSLNVLGLCVFALSNLNPLILTVGQIRDPTVWKPLKDRLRQIFCCEDQERPIDQLAIPNRYLEPLMEKDENVMAGEARMELHSFRLGPPPIMQLNGVESRNFNESMAIPKSIQKKKQPQMLCTLIAGLIHHWNQQRVQNANERDEEREINNNYNIMKEAKTKKKLTIHETVLKKNLPQIHREIRNKNLKVRFGIFTSHAPVLFKDLIDYDGVEQELGNSIDLLRNFQNIMDAETVDKKLNFITFDNKFILKSITKHERRCLLGILPAYLNHLKTNPSSLLTRIYGLYKFEVMSPYHQLNWIVMKNVSERSGPSIERMYHLKGIRLDKFAMTTDSESNIPSSKEHSGEEYFERYERAIHVDHKTRQDLLKTVQRDVDFLISQGLFNYGLNVSLVNRAVGTRFEERLCGSVILEVDESLEDKSCTPAGSMLARKLGSEYEEEKEGDNMGEETGRQRDISRDMLVNLRNPFCAVESTRENLHYSIEIDSFMTQYSLRHRIKKFFCNACESESDDTLIPTAYGERLLDYARQIINDREQAFEYMANEEIEIEKR